jgi:hypothetical protein
MEPIMMSKLGKIRQQEILERAAKPWMLAMAVEWLVIIGKKAVLTLRNSRIPAIRAAKPRVQDTGDIQPC